MRTIATAIALLLCTGPLSAQEAACGSAQAPAMQAEVALLLEPAAPSPRLARRPAGAAPAAFVGAFAGASYDADVSPSSLASPLGVCTQLSARRGQRSRKGEAAAAYQPKTRYDNTPWRFNMEQNGKRMTADEFDAWMKVKGVRVAKGAPAPVRKEDKRRRIARER